ncbi:MAG: transposase [Candidatus Lokiarchaeota archaeon]|nr:transposase [Candidatus Harpocratesius repetitus]
MVKGIRRIRHYHGALIHENSTSLFIGCHHVANRESKIPFMLKIVDWLQYLGLKIKICVIDREYYRHDILRSFKDRDVSVVTPAKNYKQLKLAKEQYLKGEKGRIQTYFIRPKSTNNRNKKLMRNWVHLYPKGNQSLGEIKTAYRQGCLSLAEASEQIYGLITTIAPQYRSKSFVYLIKRYYKMRWQIETAFRDVEVHKGIWRSNNDATRLFAEMGKYLLFNMWQFERDQIRPERRLTFQEFRDWLVDEIS